MMQEEYIQRLTETSKKKVKLLKDLLVLTQYQEEAINEEDIDKLNKQIADKQIKLDEVDKLDNEFNVYFQRLKQTLKISSLDEIKENSITGVKELQQVIRDIMELINDITGLEKQNNAKTKNILSGLGNEIKKLNQGRKTNKAYNPPPDSQPTSYFIDKKK